MNELLTSFINASIKGLVLVLLVILVGLIILNDPNNIVFETRLLLYSNLFFVMLLTMENMPNFFKEVDKNDQ